jgi:hypothetical protein
MRKTLRRALTVLFILLVVIAICGRRTVTVSDQKVQPDVPIPFMHYFIDLPERQAHFEVKGNREVKTVKTYAVHLDFGEPLDGIAEAAKKPEYRPAIGVPVLWVLYPMLRRTARRMRRRVRKEPGFTGKEMSRYKRIHGILG